MRDCTWSQVHAFRLQRHYLGWPAQPGDLLDVVSGTCGIQAQVMSAAQLALRSRIGALSIRDIECALWQDRTMVKVWSMRGTLHLLPAHEFPLYVAALKPYRLKQEQRWMARYGVDAAAIDPQWQMLFSQPLSDGTADPPPTLTEAEGSATQGCSAGTGIGRARLGRTRKICLPARRPVPWPKSRSGSDIRAARHVVSQLGRRARRGG